MHALSLYVGSDRINRAIRRLIERHDSAGRPGRPRWTSTGSDHPGLAAIGVFGPDEQGTRESRAPLYLRIHRVRSGQQQITVTVARKPVLAGIDPYRLLDWEEREGDDPLEGAEIKS